MNVLCLVLTGEILKIKPYLSCTFKGELCLVVKQK